MRALFLAALLNVWDVPGDTPLPPPRPPAADLLRFPSRQAARDAVAFAGAYVECLEQRALFEGHRWEGIERALGEARLRQRVWQELAYAWGYYEEPSWQAVDEDGNPISSEDSVRYHLAELRRLLGPDNYGAGRLPECVPS